MAPSAINDSGPQTPILPEEVSKPPEGIVLPPKDIRAIVEKTAGYVARNGVVFEDRIRDREQQNPKFSFLSPNDAYAAFYQWRLNEVREGRGTAVSAGRVGEAAQVPEPEQPKGPDPPAEFHFSARMPNISAQDLEVVRLTALFVAQRGRNWMTTLSQKEARNYQFDFLRPQHSLYQFFSRLVDQYRELLQSGPDGANAEKVRVQELELNVNDRFHMLDRAKKRAEWVKFQEKQKQAKEEEDEQERVAYAQIDWHDFVVVETVLFTEADDQADLPPPTSLNDLQSASLEQKAMMSLQPSHMRIEEAMPTDDIGMYYDPYQSQANSQAPMQFPTNPSPYSQQSQNPFQPPQSLPLPPSHTPTPMDFEPSLPPAPGRGYAQEDEEERLIRERREAQERAAAAQAAAKGGPGSQPMRIRNDYVPRAQARRQGAATALCPNCKQQIPYDELEQHMRIEMLDPRWKEQRQKAESRAATTNLSTTDVANNLKRLASQRSDVFDPVTGAPQVSDEELERRKRAAMQSYDGVTVPENVGGMVGAQPGGKTQQMQNLNIEEQIRQIHQKFKQ